MKEVLGVEMRGEPLEGQADCYYQINTTHPALGEYRQGAIVMGDGRSAYKGSGRGNSSGGLLEHGNTRVSMPCYRFQPIRKGRAIYIAGSLEAHYMSSRILSLQRILGSIIRYLAHQEPIPFRLTAPKGVYGILRRTSMGDLILWICANVGFKDASVDACGRNMCRSPTWK